MHKILLVDDDKNVLDILSSHLTKKGFDVRIAESFGEMKDILRTGAFDCMVLDVLLPDGRTIDRYSEISRMTDAPIIFLSSLANESVVAEGLLAGACDYLTKPFSPRILEIKIGAVIRNDLEKKKSQTVAHGDLAINAVSRTASFRAKEMSLTPKEFNILLFLSRNPDVVYNLDDIYSAAWGADDDGDANPLTVQAHISNLRKKLTRAGADYIATVWGNGYKFKAIPHGGD